MSIRPMLDPSELIHFTGSQEFYRHPIMREILFSEGAKYVAEEAQAYWLLDLIAFSQRCIGSVEQEEFQVWDLKVKKDQSAELTCGDGNGNTVFSKQIEQTDFPLPNIRFYFCNNCIHLPSEY